MSLVDPTLNPDLPVVERGTDERPIADPVAGLVPDLDALVCTGTLPPGACLATEHIDLSVCRPDDMCWAFVGPRGDLEHVNHQCPCWHEVIPNGGGTPSIQNLLVDGPVEPVTVDVDEPGESPDPPALVTIHDGGAGGQGVILDPFIQLRDGIYTKLRDEGNPEELSIVLATIYAMVVPSQIPETMAMLRSVGDSISGVLGDGGGGGLMGKILGRAMKGNG